jgi:hypothetical protein
MIRLLLLVAYFIAAVTTFCAAIAVVAFYRWITRDEPVQYANSRPRWMSDEPYFHDNVRRASFVPKPKGEYPRQTVADIVTFNAYRAAKKRGRA